MTRVSIIALAIGLSTSTAHATPSTAEQAAARGRAGDHAGAIALYRKAYELEGDPALLVRIAHQLRLAGELREALAQFCTYMYIDAAGELADDASAHARALAAQLGRPARTDHEACSPPASKAPDATSALFASPAAPPPRITKREVAGFITLGGSIAGFGLSLREGRELRTIRENIAVATPDALAALRARDEATARRQKLWLGAGGVALVAGGILYVTGRADRKRAERAYAAPVITKSGGGIVLGGRF